MIAACLRDSRSEGIQFQLRTIVLDWSTRAYEKSTPCPTRFGNKSNRLAPVHPWTCYIHECWSFTVGTAYKAYWKEKNQPVARNVEKASPCCSSQNSSEPQLGRAAFQLHSNHKAENTSMGFKILDYYYYYDRVFLSGFSLSVNGGKKGFIQPPVSTWQSDCLFLQSSKQNRRNKLLSVLRSQRLHRDLIGPGCRGTKRSLNKRRTILFMKQMSFC